MEARLKLSDIAALLFPLRTHLEREIAYLQSQLAQERRRVDVLQEGLIQAKRPSVLIPAPRTTSATRPKPVGWEATRAEIRNESREVESSGIPGSTDAGSQDSPEGDGIAA